MKVNVLGTEYDMQVKGKAEDDTLMRADGYCQNYSKKIVIKRTEDMLDGDASIDAKKSRNEHVKRHELVHAFLFESGLDDRSDDEELVDWIAIQVPKLVRAFKDVENIC